MKNLACIFHGIAKGPRMKVQKYEMMKRKWTRFKKAINSLKMTSESERAKLLKDEKILKKIIALFLKTDNINFWDFYIKSYDIKFYNIINEDSNPLYSCSFDWTEKRHEIKKEFDIKLF